MKRITLVTVGQSTRGTFGVLRVGQVPFALTLEKPWSDNQQNISCIPMGVYRCVRVQSPRFGKTFEVTQVPGRTHILFHRGNYLEDTEGCILVAEEFSGTYEKPMIVSSHRGFMEMMKLLQDDSEFELEILR